jgi:GT2 family glycosyltransferase
VTPAVAVAIASHDRPLRLRWLLNALEEQTLERARFEVVVCFDDRGEEAARMLAAHPLAPRALRLAPGPGPSAKRNAAWRAARAPLVAFTDDDCRPPAEWLERLLAAADAHPGAVVQGATRPDPDELALFLRAPHARSQAIDPPTDWGQTCNIAYPRALLDRLGGFDEALPVAAGEDTDLLQRARRAGARQVAAPEAVTFHAVEVEALPRRARQLWRWQHTAYVVKRHPQLRRAFPLGVFWKRRHATLALAVAGAATRRPVLALPYVADALPRYGASPRGVARAISELPGAALADAIEMAACARGSVRYRTVLL